ncbi:MAG: PKD repeat protein [Paracoccaceae bacterium]|jgi:PKD repeat protein
MKIPAVIRLEKKEFVMGMASKLAAAAFFLAGFSSSFATAQTPGSMDGLLVVYGALAPSREGDVDRREQIFFSLPAGMKNRFYVRVFDPEVSGSGDFTYGGTGNSRTVFRVFGGSGAFSKADRPQPVADGAREPRRTDMTPVTGPGRMLKETTWRNDKQTDGRWVNFAGLLAAQGEVIDGRAFFRIDVQGAGGDDGNGYSLDVSLSRDRNLRPDGLDMFAYRPTVRWSKGQPATQIRISGTASGPFTVQSFDAANADIALVNDYADLGLRVSAQDFWTSDQVDSEETNLAISLSGGFETPNDVTLALFDAAGDPVALQMPPYRAPVPSRPSVIGTVRPLADCRAVAFDASASTGLTPLSFIWDFGDGSISSDPVVAHRYDQPGMYTARLRILEDGDRPGRGAELDLNVHVRNAPIAVPGADTIVAPGEMLEFDGTGSRPSDSPITRYHWTFGDGTLASGAHAQKAYDTPGEYRAVLRVEDDSAHPCNIGVQTRKVTVNFPPVAEAGTDQSAVVDRPISFDGTASYDIDGAIETYSWDMGDGTILDGAKVTHNYTTSGDYLVSLTVKDNSGVINNTAIDRMRVGVNAPPVPHFSIPDRPVSVSEAALLDASMTTDADGEVLSYQWDFGDGARGEGKVVDYAWTKAGKYTVTLTVVDDSGTTSARQTISMQIQIDAAPVADTGPDQNVTASVVLFDGSGSVDADGKVTEWIWDFGDGATATGQKVSHAYLRPGTYEVSLVVRDDSTSPLNTDRDTMLVTINAAPIADAGPPQTVAPGEEFVVNGQASVDPDGSISDHVWTFPDGTQVQEVRAAHSFANPGLNRVRLTVYDDFRGGATMDESEVLITVNAQPVAVAGADLLIAPGDSVTFDAGQSFDPDGSLAGFRWEFDDLGMPLDARVVERAYVTPGIWSAQLVVTDDSGVANATAGDDRTIRVNHSPVAEAGPEIDSDLLQIEFDASKSSDADGDALMYQWDFGDGLARGFGRVTTHVYPRSGIFPVTLWVDDGTGLSNAKAVDATTVTINARPVADAGGNRDVCSGDPILFDASASTDPDGGLLQYSWDFGDGSNSDLINPTKTYENPGAYPVTLRIQNETGTQRGTAIDRIAALVREGPIADAGQDLTVCTNQQVRFDGSGSTDADGAVNAFSWTLGDGGTGSGEKPAYVFERPGDYSVTLTITGEAREGCSPFDTDVAKVTVIAAPELAISGKARAAAGIAAEYTADLNKLSGARASAFEWQFSDGAKATGTKASHVFAEPGVFYVDLTARLESGNAGCSVLTARRKIIVNAAPEPQIDVPDSVAVGQALSFDAGQSRDSDGAISQFAWDFGDGSASAGVLAAHRFETPGVYTVTLTVIDDAGVGNSRATSTRQITVNPAPMAGLQAPSPVCPAEEVPWTVAASETTKVNWMFGDGTTATGPSVSHAFSKPGLFPISVLLDDGAGLQNSRRTEEVYVRINSAPTAFAGPDRTVCPGQTVVFDAGPSGDLDGKIVAWIWEFSDGSRLEGPTVEHVFDQPADLQVRLSVQDDSGAQSCAIGTDTARVLVNSAPQVDAGPDQTVPVGAAHDVVRFDATDASDPDKQGLRVNWSFGDGSEAAGAVARHRFTAPGSYTVTVQARDTTGLACGVATDTALITATARD